MEQLYCIECEYMVTVVGWNDVCHIDYKPEVTYSDETKTLAEFKLRSCYGPFASCPPPEIPDGWYGTGWQDNLVEPDPEELEMMDRAAESLKLEFINGL